MKLSFSLLLLACAAAQAQPCEPEPAIHKDLAQLERDIRSASFASDAVKKLASAILDRHPEDYFVNVRWMSLMRPRTHAERDAFIERYKARAGSHAGDLKFQVLYARALVGSNTPLAISLLEKAPGGERDPRVLLTLAFIYSYGKLADRSRTRAHLAAYYAACPASLDSEATNLLVRFGDPELIAKQAAAFRARLTAETDPDSLRSWEDVWNLEFKARPVTQHDALRKQIAADLQRLEAIPAPEDDRWAGFLANGYKLAGDPDAQRRAEDKLIAAYPDSFAARSVLRARWSKDHPRPDPGDADDVKQAYYRAVLASAEKTLARSPGDFESLMSRFNAVSHLKGSTGEQVAAAGEAMLGAQKGSGWSAVPPFHLQVARALLERKVNIACVPDLVAAGIKDFREREGDIKDDRDPDERTAPDSGNAFFVDTDAARILLDAAKALGNAKVAAAAVAEVESIKAEQPVNKSSILGIRARFAELEGRKLDALLLYRAALDVRPADFKPPKKDELAENAERLWKELGGTAATKPLWDRKDKKVEVAQGGGRWESPKQSMSKWELSDLAGKTWTLASLEGRTLLINVWATWCGPCRSEHPYLEKLYQKTKDRADVQVLSFNVDDEVGAVAPYVKENKYTFPVLLAGSYVNELLPYISIPRNWIVDATGKWRLEQIGFGSAETWEQDILAKLAELR